MALAGIGALGALDVSLLFVLLSVAAVLGDTLCATGGRRGALPAPTTPPERLTAG